MSIYQGSNPYAPGGSLHGFLSDEMKEAMSEPPARMFIAIGEIVDGEIVRFVQPLLVADPGPVPPKASPSPAIEMYEVRGVWMTLDDARAEAAAINASRLAAPFNSGKWP